MIGWGCRTGEHECVEPICRACQRNLVDDLDRRGELAWNGQTILPADRPRMVRTSTRCFLPSEYTDV